MDERLDRSRSEPDGSRGPVPLEQIRENERAAATPEGTSTAGRTVPTVPTYGEGADGVRGDDFAPGPERGDR